MRRVVCTGLGVVSPLGIGVRESWAALLASKSGIVPLRSEHLFEGCQSQVAGYVPREEYLSKLEGYSYIKKHNRQLSDSINYAILAADEAMIEAHLLDESGELSEKFRMRAGVCIGQGIVDFEEIYRNGLLVADDKGKNLRKMSPFFMTKVLTNMAASNVSIKYKLYGPNHCASTACATGAHSIGDAFNFIRTNQADIMICGSTEAAINSISIAGFERLKALCTKYNDEPSKASRPFDEDRAGFVIGEGAGVIVLEAYEHAKLRGLKDDDIICDLIGYGASGDAFHPTAPSPDGIGAARCIKAALEDARISADKIDHINAHATSTPMGDNLECEAMEKIFFTDQPTSDRGHLTVTSCKSSIGHLLGGAGSVETVFAILSCRDGLLPPNLNLARPIKTKTDKIQFVGHTIKWDKKFRCLVKNSFGFGGTNASLVISNYSDPVD